MALVDATQPVTEYLLDGNDSAKNLFREIENQSPQEALRLILAELDSGAIEAEQAIGLMPLDIVQGVMFGSVDPQEGATILGQHTLKTPGAGAGVIVTSADAARALLEQDSAAKFVLLLHETTAEDIDVLKKAQGVITLSGGSSSHASIIARQSGIPGLIGFNTCDLDSIYAGLSVTIDGSTGVLYAGEQTLIPGVIEDIKQGNLAGIPAYFLRVLQIAEQLKIEANDGMAVLANTDDERGAAVARGLFAQGIGVVRTEHMFFASEVLKTVQALFLTNDAQQRQQYCDKLAPQQQEDFKAILLAMDGLPVTVRLHDQPLYELLTGLPDTEQKKGMKEQNSMLGFRAIRMASKYPEVYEMQIRAVLEAAAELKESGKNPCPKIMVPMVMISEEMETVSGMLTKIEAEFKANGREVPAYTLGTMLEIPAACLAADELAKMTSFGSFGTNDLTQMTLGISRDDLAALIMEYVESEKFAADPFVTIHPKVLEIMKTAIEKGKGVAPQWEVSVCGEQGADPESIQAFERIGVDKVSVSPPSIPQAIICTTQAMLYHMAELALMARAQSQQRASRMAA